MIQPYGTVTTKYVLANLKTDKPVREWLHGASKSFVVVETEVQRLVGIGWGMFSARNIKEMERFIELGKDTLASTAQQLRSTILILFYD